MAGTIRGIIPDGMVIVGTGATHITIVATGVVAIGRITML